MKHYSFLVEMKDQEAYSAFMGLLEQRHPTVKRSVDHVSGFGPSDESALTFFLNVALNDEDRAPWVRTIELWEEMGFRYTASLTNYSEDKPPLVPNRKKPD